MQHGTPDLLHVPHEQVVVRAVPAIFGGSVQKSTPVGKCALLSRSRAIGEPPSMVRYAVAGLWGGSWSSVVEGTGRSMYT